MIKRSPNSFAEKHNNISSVVDVMRESSTPGYENVYETLKCLKWGMRYGLISRERYEEKKSDVVIHQL
jgi:hypothetical protein